MELNDRAKAHEKKFANSNELEFQARTKAYRRLIRFVAEEKLNLDTEKAQSFCDEMILVMVRTPDQNAFFTKLQIKIEESGSSLPLSEMQKIYRVNLAMAHKELDANF